MNATLPPDTGAPPSQPLPKAVEARLAHLFRGSRQRGLIHPLEHIVQQYRAEQPAPAPEAQP